MMTPSYQTRSVYVLVVAVALCVAAPITARVLSFGGSDLLTPRLSIGDCDGDGVIDAAMAGAVSGRVDEAASLRSARLDWYAGPGTGAVTSAELHVVNDLAHADLDGDGRDEIIVVGANTWRILQLEGGQLRQHAAGNSMLPLWRVAAGDVDGDGRDEVALVTLERGLTDEVPRATIQLVAVDMTTAGAGLHSLDTWDVAAHIGDLCFVSSPEGAVLIVETGAEEVGGRLHRLSVAGGVVREQTSILTGADRLRILSLSAVAVHRGTLLSLADVSGRVRVVEWQGDVLRRHAVAPLPGSGASLARFAGEDVQMWLAPLRPGDPLGWWSPVDF